MWAIYAVRAHLRQHGLERREEQGLKLRAGVGRGPRRRPRAGAAAGAHEHCQALEQVVVEVRVDGVFAHALQRRGEVLEHEGGDGRDVAGDGRGREGRGGAGRGEKGGSWRAWM